VVRLVVDQGIEMASMGSVLSDERMIQVITPGVARSMSAIFVEPAGLNIRNNTAHGLYAAGSDLSTQAYYTVMGLLTAAYILGRVKGTIRPPQL
jgi:hypothetical protein